MNNEQHFPTLSNEQHSPTLSNEQHSPTLSNEQHSPTLSIVIPAYNSSGSLGALIAQLSQTLPTLTGEYEIILVNDGSKDTTWQVLVELVQDYPHVRAINLSRNFGQHNALLCGILSA